MSNFSWSSFMSGVCIGWALCAVVLLLLADKFMRPK